MSEVDERARAALDAPMPEGTYHHPAATVREYLIALLAQLWEDPPKRMWGESGWATPLEKAMINAGLVDGTLDGDGDVTEVDVQAFDMLIVKAINTLGMTSPEELRQRPEDQVLPTPNEHLSIHAQVAADLMERERIGISRYGTPLQPCNGRDADQDLYEELLDAAAYQKQRMIEKALARSRVGAFPTMMQAWVWLRDAAGCTSSTPIDSAPIVFNLAESKVRHSEEGRALLAAAVAILQEAGVLP